MSSDVKFGAGGRHDAQLVKDFLQSREPTVLQGGAGKYYVVVQGVWVEGW